MNSLKTFLGIALACSGATFAASEQVEKQFQSKSSASSSPLIGERKSGQTNQATIDHAQVEYLRLLQIDDAAQKEADRWIKEFNAFEAQAPGSGGSQAALSLKVEQRLDLVRKAYEDFLTRYPKHVEGRLAYGSFLNDIQEEAAAVVQWDKARELDPTNPAAYNNLANYYGHFGPIKKAFEYYEKAIELNPKEPVYLQNFATTTYLFRKDAMERYGISETEVFNRALDLYKRAIKLDPQNFLLAVDLAESYYGIRPLRTQEALDAWNHALSVAENDAAKQGVFLHMARVQLNSGMFEEARQKLDMVTHPEMQALKVRLERNLAEKKAKAASANAEGVQPNAAPQEKKITTEANTQEAASPSIKQ
ncbi:MAG: tetratricopeptide repeat protein [Verrucomicrobiales bacterium]